MDLPRDLLLVFTLTKAQEIADDFNKGEERGRPASGRTVALEEEDRGCPQTLAKLVDQPGFANPGFTDHMDYVEAVLLDRVAVMLQAFQLTLATDERRVRPRWQAMSKRVI